MVTNVFESSKEMRIDLMLTTLLVAKMKISKIYSGMVDYSSRSNEVDNQI